MITKNCPTEQCLVIVPSFPIGRRVEEALQKALGEHRAQTFGKALPQGDRNSILADFNDKKLQVLITCELGLLGVKLAEVGTIVFYEPPEDWGLAFSAMHQCGISSYCFVHILYDPDSEREMALKKVMDDKHRALRGCRTETANCVSPHSPSFTMKCDADCCFYPSRWYFLFNTVSEATFFLSTFDKTMVQGRMIRLGYTPHRERRR